MEEKDKNRKIQKSFVHMMFPLYDFEWSARIFPQRPKRFKRGVKNNPSEIFFQGYRKVSSGLMRNNLYSKKITFIVKKRLHSRQQPCRSPQLTVIGVGLRKISSKFCLPSVRAARRHCRCLAFRLFYFILRLFSVYTFFMRKP